ncbi:MAG: hypothetical protein K8R77_00840 [Anaerolineaceae bacterium]|nr:hypothetical protein [Anaerolineaceae bacterium]
MKLDTGTLIVVGMVLLFYLRLIVIQWGKASRFNRSKGKTKSNTYEPLKFKFNWLLIGIGAAMIIFGILMKAVGLFGIWFEEYWWLFTSIGIFIFGMGIRN